MLYFKILAILTDGLLGKYVGKLSTKPVKLIYTFGRTIILSLECGANFSHIYYFLAYALSTFLVLVYHVYPSAFC